jgi:protein SCO1/2
MPILAVFLATWIFQTQAEPAKEGSRLAVIGKAAPIELLDQDGAKVTSKELQGKVLLVGFIFTTCSGSCPATTHRMGLIQRELQRRGMLKDGRVRLVSITLDPERDRTEVLREYMRRYDADRAAWSFLTGPPADVARTIAAWGMWAKPAPNGQLDHPSRVFLIDAKGTIREIYSLEFLKEDWVVEDIQLLLEGR